MKYKVGKRIMKKVTNVILHIMLESAGVLVEDFNFLLLVAAGQIIGLQGVILILKVKVPCHLGGVFFIQCFISCFQLSVFTHLMYLRMVFLTFSRLVLPMGRSSSLVSLISLP